MTSTGWLRHAPWLASGLLAGCSLALNPEIPEGTNTNDAGGNQTTCSTHSECTPLGETMVCGAAGVCVNALTSNCARYTGPLGEDNAVMVGSIMPTVGDFTSIGLPIEQAFELAVVELNDSGGLPGGRRLVLLECDSSGSRDQGLAVADHLIESIGVPVIFGPAFSSIFIDVTTLRSAPAEVMTISPSATSPTISGIDDDGLGWRTAASDTFQGVAIADLIRMRGFSKVIALGKDDAYGRGLLNRVGEELIAEIGEDNYFSLTFPDPGTTENPDLGGAVASALEAVPDPEVVVLLGTTEVAQLLDLFELGLIDTSTSVRYILADGGKADETLALVMEDESLLSRIEGTEADHRNGTLYTAFNLRFSQRFGATAGIYTANAYDAAYMVAYAMASLPQQMPVTGRAVAQAMSKLVTGRRVEAGPDHIAEARNTLSAGADINYEGASGPLDFDLETGEAGADVARWVIEKRASNGEFRFVSAGRYEIDDTGRGTWTVNE